MCIVTEFWRGVLDPCTLGIWARELHIVASYKIFLLQCPTVIFCQMNDVLRYALLLFLFEATGKQLLERGELQRRCTIIPLNKIAAVCVEPDKIKLAKALV